MKEIGSIENQSYMILTIISFDDSLYSYTQLRNKNE